ncbi:MAG: hypothetical protein HOE45_10635 [Gammaproteobacteria bacterium]|jgi:hypothetical protein|nr:hypothetical protein [Gammaproteobacteria bacterium]MBT5223137.1 hypothetical protein [Gammaproteobacteria bacterium]MBT6420645.1 hypothetical protein [Gammaproteobacteria bacterium]MBT6576370.1 hypothetical protein [Gammaproteobacteria bacterium]MBT7436886.1 hypothetical protein [Gammaproteobacteria bacterium]
MQKENDNKIAIERVKTTQEKFLEFNTCIFDKGFHSKGNQTGHGTTTISQTKKATRLNFSTAVSSLRDWCIFAPIMNTYSYAS